MKSQQPSHLLKEEYIQIKRLLYQKLFKTIMMGFSFMGVIQLFRALYIGTSLLLLPVILVTAFIFVFYGTRQILQLENSQELVITLFLLIINSACVLFFFHWDPDTLSNIYNSFYCGYINALFEAAMTNRIPSFTYRTYFRVFLLLFRFFTVDVVDQTVIPNQILCCLCCIYLDYDKEKHDQNLFGSYFHSREKLNKFKDLVVNDIPEGVIIMTEDLTKCLFANNSFMKLVGDDCSKKFKESLAKFRFYDVSNSNTDTTNENTESSRSHYSKQNLLTFLQELIINNDLRTSKVSCNLTFNNSNNPNGPSSEELVFEAKVVSLVWDEYLAIGIILHDVTQQNAIIRLKIAANQQKDRILATVSHELRTPLNGILGMIQVIQQKVHDSEILQYLSICSNSGYLLLGLVNSILDLNLIRANKLKLYPEKIHLSKFLQEIVQLFEYQCKTKSIFIKLKISCSMPEFIKTDKNRLSQILINLIGNALKFTSQGGITISATNLSICQEYVEFSVEDTGVGIKEEDKGKLFQIFGKLEDIQNNQGTIVNSQGVGLGLTISNDLAKVLCCQKHQKGIRLQSKYGKGTKFAFLVKKDLNSQPHPQDSQQDFSYEEPSASFFNEGDINNDDRAGLSTCLSPLKKPYCGSLSTKLSPLSALKSPFFKDKTMSWSSAQPSPKKSLQDLFVLIVDDNPLNIAVAKAFALKNNYQAKTAFCGQTAIDIMLNNDFKAEPIKLILMDLQMPLMDGYQTTRALKDLMRKGEIPETPIIALTANDDEEDRKACKKAGMCHYLSKPIKESELAKILAKDYRKMSG